MKSKYFYFISALLIFNFEVIAQSFTQLKTDISGVQVILHTKSLQDNDVEGSPFFSEVWEKGEVRGVDNHFFKLDSMNYNIYLNKIIFMEKGNISAFADFFVVKEFVLGNNRFKYMQSTSDNRFDYYQVLANGKKIKLLKRYHSNYIEGKPSNGMLPEVKAKYITYVDYYIEESESTVKRIDTKKEDIIDLMSDKSNEVVPYFKKNKIKTKSEESLISVFEYYNSLF